MKKGTIKICAIVGVILVTILIVSLLGRRSDKNLTTDTKDVSLPMITLYKDDTKINELYGYTTQMKACAMRDTITPLNSDRILPIRIQSADQKITAISYEIRNMSGEKLIAQKEVTEYEQKDGAVSANLKIQNIIEEGTEYLLILKLEQGDKDIYYYTRMMQPVDSDVDESLRFVMDFHNKSMNKEAGGTLATYLEPDATGDNTTLSRVTIHSSLNQLTWGKLDYEQIGEPIPSIKEISSSCNVITLNYQVMSKEGEQKRQCYNVEEYYRVRHTTDRVYLLDYERTMEQIFTGETDAVYDKYLQLGICDKKVNYASNESGTVVGFVQAGELWSYNQNNGQLAKVFSFRGDDLTEKRENYDQHDIRIVNVDEEGSIDFLVYGYMNSGAHEGRVGISVCRYDSVANATEEELFLPVDTSYQVMKTDLGELAYRNNQKEFFIVAGKDLYKIQTDSLEVSKEKENLVKDTYVVSDGGRYFVYAQEDTGNLRLEDLETGSTYEIAKENSQELKPLGFMGEDFIYGISSQAGEPMQEVKIISTKESHDVLKDYQKQGYYISGIVIDGNTIYINRVVSEGGTYTEAETDTIMNNEGSEASQVLVHTSQDETKQMLVQLEFADNHKEANTKLMTPKQMVDKSGKEVKLKTKDKTLYYAYTAGKVTMGGENAAEVIHAANSNMGVVVDNRQNYIWKRMKKNAQANVLGANTQVEGGNSLAKCLNLILQKEGVAAEGDALLQADTSVEKILSDKIKNAIGLNLTGCTADEMLYYVNLGHPVIGMTGAQEAMLIVGYDSTTISVCNADTGNVERLGIEEANNRFAAAGNVFYAYVDEAP